MPQLSKGGKYVFGISVLDSHLCVRLPPMAMEEYGIAGGDDVILFTGSKSTGGFCLTSRRLLADSPLKHLLTECPAAAKDAACLEFVRYKGRGYCRAQLDDEGRIPFTPQALAYLGLEPGCRLVAIRSSNIAFTLGAKGPLMEKAAAYPGKIEQY